MMAKHHFYRVNKLLRSFHLEPDRIMSILRMTGGVISGSSVLFVMKIGTFKPDDIDFFVNKFNGRKFMRWIQAWSEYHVEEPEIRLDEIYPTRMFTTAHRLKIEGKPGSINVVVSNTSSAIQPIFDFHSTIVMNFINPFGIACAYPRLTFDHRGLMNPGIQSPDKLNKCYQKYRDRGFSIVSSLRKWKGFKGHECGVDPSCGQTRRSIRDGHVLFADLPGYIGKQHILSRSESVEWKLSVGRYCVRKEKHSPGFTVSQGGRIGTCISYN
jgi:hypothetical protein